MHAGAYEPSWFKLSVMTDTIERIVNTYLTRLIYLIYLSCIKKFSFVTFCQLPGQKKRQWRRVFKKFGLPPSVSCPVNRNVNDEECLRSLVCHLLSVAWSIETSMTKSVFFWDWFQRGEHLFCKFRMAFTLTEYLEFLSWPKYSVYRQKWVNVSLSGLVLDSRMDSSLIPGHKVARKQKHLCQFFPKLLIGLNEIKNVVETCWSIKFMLSRVISIQGKEPFLSDFGVGCRRVGEGG